MVFSTIIFLFRFLPITLALYYLAPAKLKNTVLFLCSLVFYCWGEVRFFPVMVALILINYVCGLAIEHFDAKPALRRIFLLIALIGSLGMLFYFKYANFVLRSANALLGTAFAEIQGIGTLPLGISFYTFQTLSYSIDVYRRDVKAERNIIDFGAYVVMFPQLIAGPIVKYRDVSNQLHVYNLCGAGQRLHPAGVAGHHRLQPAAVLRLLRLFHDGHRHGQNAGLRLPCKLQLPVYLCFHHRVLASLAHDPVRLVPGVCVYPAGRQPQGPEAADHEPVHCGAAHRHLAWCQLELHLLGPVLLCAEKLFLLPHLQKGKVWPHIYTLFLVVVGWAMFVGNDTGVSFGLLFQKLFIPSGGVSPLYFLRNYGVLLIVSVICCTPLIEKIWNALRRNVITRCATILLLLVVSTAYVVGSTNSPFLYFNF